MRVCKKKRNKKFKGAYECVSLVRTRTPPTGVRRARSHGFRVYRPFV